jgi:cysteine desulfurase
MIRTYLDWNATTPPLPEVIDGMAAAARRSWGNPASVHWDGRAARACVEDAREAVAQLARCDARDLVFTSGGTEANNLALRSAFARAPGLLVTSRIEHASVVRVAEALEAEGRARVRWLNVRPDGIVDLEDLARACTEGEVRLIAIQAVNSETGVVQPLREVLEIARKARVAMHVDAVQAFGRTEEVAEEAETRSIAAHKIRGPKAIGALATQPGVFLAPLLFGGSQERGLRPGTVDPVAATGFALAARNARTSSGRWRMLSALRGALENGLLGLAPRARINGLGAPRAPHVTSVAFPGWEAAVLVAAFDLEGVAVSGGSACSAGTVEASSVLAAMGDDEAATCSVRFSLGEETTQSDVDAALAAASRVLKRLVT